MNAKPETFEQLLSHWTTLELSADLDVQYVTARKMRERQSVGTQHWPRLTDAARAKGISITQEDLLAMRNRRVAA
mgnify:CR=1 FL=1